MSCGRALRAARAALPILLTVAVGWAAGCATRPQTPAGVVEQTFQKLKQDPNNLRPLIELAQVFISERDFLRARQYLAIAEQHPSGEQYRDELFKLAMVIAVRSQQYRDAIARCEQRLRDKEELGVRVLLANLWEALPDLRAAERERQLVLIHHPEAHEQWVELARFYERSFLPSARDLAKRSYERYLKLAPDGKVAAQARAALRTLAFDAKPQLIN